MDENHEKELLVLIDKFSRREGLNMSGIPNVSFFKSTVTDIPLPNVYNPSLCIIVQGSKEVLLGRGLYHYGPLEYLIASVDLPVIGRITEATQDQPYLVIKIDVDISQLSELLIHAERQTIANNRADCGLFIGKMDTALGESVLRLICLLETPEDIPVLSSQMLREIYYRMLRSEYGDTIAQIALKGSHMQRISIAIQKLKRDFHLPVTVEHLAELAGMSVSSFHAHFKSVTTMSPLQFQKSIRLMEARSLMITNDMNAASTAYRVGYESVSHFNREYARMFGNPPGRDINLLKEQNGRRNGDRPYL